MDSSDGAKPKPFRLVASFLVIFHAEDSPEITVILPCLVYSMIETLTIIPVRSIV